MGFHFQEFIFEDYSFDRTSGVLELRYSFDGGLTFTETIEFPLAGVNWQDVNPTAFEQALRNLHLAGGVSYYKTICPRRISIRGQPLSKTQANFWNKFYTLGLGEFFFTNGIDPRGLVSFPYEQHIGEALEPPRIALPERALVPIGGGKDSIVVAELVKRSGMAFTLITLNDHKAMQDVSALLGKRRIIARRKLPPKLFELNARGALNGHVPITGYISFFLTAAALLYGYRFIVMALEKSADVPQASEDGIDVNHQYSKSSEFERDFRSYVTQFLTPDIEYFSLLRPFYEIKIAQMFARIAAQTKGTGSAADAKGYFDVFTSCNSNFRQRGEKSRTNWCGRCPKCAFMFAALAPFVSRKRLIDIFGGNLLVKHSLIATYRSLLGLSGQLPFACVGTAEETRAALWLLHTRDDYRKSPVIQLFRQEVLPLEDDWESLADNVLRRHPCGHIQERFEEVLRDW